MRFPSLATAALAAVFVTGCGPGPDLVKAPNTAADDPLAASAYPDIVLRDDLHEALVKEKPTIRPTAGDDPLLIRVPLRSVVDVPVRVRWQVTFSTDAGEQLTDNPVWHEETFAPRERKFIQAQALSVRATKWNLVVGAD